MLDARHIRRFGLSRSCASTMQSRHIRLRSIENSDVAIARQVMCDPVRSSLVTTGPPLTTTGCAQWLSNLDSLPGNYVVAIDGQAQGLIWWENIRDGNALISIARTGGRPGLGLEAAALGAVVTFLRMGMRRATFLVVESNVVSQKVVLALGGRCEGVVREGALVDGRWIDVHQYGILRREAAWLDMLPDKVVPTAVRKVA